jgi:predicted Fe-Mo cluster-binding NifX family protein
MRIAITSEGPQLDAELDPRFGRCRYLLLVDTEDLSFDAVENPHRELAQGVGIQLAQLAAEQGAKAVLTGQCGPKAEDVLAAARIELVTGCRGTVREAAEAYRAGKLRAPAASTPPASPEQGRRLGGQWPGRAGGGGMGRGRGMGRGMGRGRRWAKGT